jgi:hypothetical protein
MDKSRMRVSAHISRRQISDKSAGMKMPSRPARRRFLVVVGFAVAGGLLNANTALARAAPCSQLMSEQECCSLEGCAGHVLGSRANAKECKKIHHGKSWHPASDGRAAAECTNF